MDKKLFEYGVSIGLIPLISLGMLTMYNNVIHHTNGFIKISYLVIPQGWIITTSQFLVAISFMVVFISLIRDDKK